MRRVFVVLLVAAGYILAGLSSQLLALPAGYASIIWLPAGIALVALLLLGWSMWPAVLMGATIMHAWRLLSEGAALSIGDILIASVGLGIGAVAQVVTGVWLVRRYVGNPGPLDMARDIVLFLLLGCGVANLIEAIWGPAILVLIGMLEPDAYLQNVGMWWLGDTFGVVITAPILLTVWATPHDLWRSRRISLSVPLVGILILALVSFTQTRDREIERLGDEFEHKAVRVSEDLVLHFQRRLDSVHAIASMIQTTGGGDPQTVVSFASQILEPLPGALAVLWMPREDLDAPAGAAVEDAQEPRFVLADEPEQVYRVSLSAWHADAQDLVQDLMDEQAALVRGAREAMRAARDAGTLVATAPVILPRPSESASESARGSARGPARGLVIVMPIYDRHARTAAPLQTVAARRLRLRGFVAEVILLDPLFEDVLRGVREKDLAIRLWDETEPGQAYMLQARDPAQALMPSLAGHARCELAGRRWHVMLTPTIASVPWRRPGDTWVTLGVGLLITAVLSSLLLLLSGHTARVQRQALEQATALNQAQHSLQEVVFLRRLANSNIIGIMVVHPGGQIHDANDALLDMIGYDREDLANGLRWDSMTPPEWAEVDRKAVEESQASDTVPAWEKEYLRKDGSRVPVMIGVARLGDDDLRHVAFVVDLTKVKQAEAELRRRTAELENYKLIINSTPIAVHVKEYSGTQPGIYVLANPKAAELMGQEQPVGCTDRDWLPGELLAEVAAHDRGVLQGREPVILEERLVDTQTGQVSQYLCTKVPLFDADGEPYAIATMALDITEQKQLTERLAALVNAIPDVMFRLRTDGVCLDFKNNRNAAFMTLGSEELVGKNLFDESLPAEVRELGRVAVGKAARSSEIQEIEYSMDTPRGTRHYEARVVKSGRDEIVMLQRDITDARRTREALEQTNSRLQAVNEELREFAYVASHDLQEPLRTVRSFAEMLDRRYNDAFDETGRKWLGFIATGTQRMRDLIEDLLAYSRAGHATSIEPVDTNTLVAGILDDSRASIDDANAEIAVGTLPTVMASETELRQVFLNLISNALKFRRSDVAPRIEISASLLGRAWCFAVADNGIGIAPEYHERIFQVFQRLHGRGEYPGTGIGLALVKKIIERRGGQVSLQSEPGQGTRFAFTWPMHGDRSSSQPHSLPPNDASKGPVPTL